MPCARLGWPSSGRKYTVSTYRIVTAYKVRAEKWKVTENIAPKIATKWNPAQVGSSIETDCLTSQTTENLRLRLSGIKVAQLGPSAELATMSGLKAPAEARRRGCCTCRRWHEGWAWRWPTSQPREATTTVQQSAACRVRSDAQWWRHFVVLSAVAASTALVGHESSE